LEGETRKMNNNNRVADLKRIEQLAIKAREDLIGGKYYEGKSNDLDRLEKVARDAKIERLELELSRK
jgi:hypothetical protein